MSINDSDLTQSILYGYSYTGNLPPGLTFTEINDMKMGYAKRVSYEVPIGYKLSGTPTAPGTYTFTITLKVPHTSKGTNPWIQASATSTLLYSQQFTIVVK
jgi:hypothetical protein